MTSQRIPRRDILRQAGTGALLAAGGMMGFPSIVKAARLGPSERVRIAVIGCGGMGTRHIEALAVNPNCDLAAVCDCYTPRYENAVSVVKKLSGKTPDGYQDFRRVLDRADIDAIFAPMPDHWHPLMTILGCEAGKDVYVEKPASPTVAEGRAMVDAARRYGRVVQLGTQQRSMPIFQEAVRLIHEGRIGKVTSATCWVGINGTRVGFTPGQVPAGLDWDLWLGPAPWAPYSADRQFGFMGCQDYARGGELTNWGVHLMDIVHWGIRQDRPLSVQATGGLYRGSAGSENYETVDAIWEYPGCTVTWEQRHKNEYNGRSYGIKFQGTEGTLLVDRGSYEVHPESLGIKRVEGEPEKSWANPPHHNNFFDSIKTRQPPVAEIEQGHRSTTPLLIAGIALKTRRKLYWDAETETFLRDEAANRYLSRAYRAPWHL
ncbi:Gfo/Idh/MocA family protein [Aquisphaera insulae]|uniref:Gfo/Idh/MocA family protein n=1 Tax=Aquisphaera insulae TaxID=2712864 RepID=UPI0013E9E63A|nr:Gfo/Idh/MocA family oxidoreductase [Aquisphaera insulae]